MPTSLILKHAAFADKLANDILGVTPLVRIGLAPKQIRVYRAGDPIRSRKLIPSKFSPVPVSSWPSAGTQKLVGLTSGHTNPRSPSALTATTIPAVTQAQIERFTAELFKVVPRRLLPTRQGRPGGAGAPQTISERLRMLACCTATGSAPPPSCSAKPVKVAYNETLWAVVTSAAGRGISEDVVWELVERHFQRRSQSS